MSYFSHFFYGLNLDVLLATFCLLQWYATAVGLQPHFQTYFLLLSLVWVIYSLDHLLDGKRFTNLKSKIHSRYSFVVAYKPLVITVVAIFIAIDTFLVFHYLTVNQIIVGFLLGLVVVLYLFLHAIYIGKPIPKELLIALVFCSGIIISTNFIVDFWLNAILFLLILSNTLIYSLIGKKEDEVLQMTSSVIVFGEKNIRWVLILILLIIILISLLKMHFEILLIAAIYLFIITTKSDQKRPDLCRNVCDLLFVTLLLF